MRADRHEPLTRHALAFVLAGGRGSRLMELTDRRAKPAVYFGGKSRIIDFALSNAVPTYRRGNSGQTIGTSSVTARLFRLCYSRLLARAARPFRSAVPHWFDHGPVFTPRSTTTRNFGASPVTLRCTPSGSFGSSNRLSASQFTRKHQS